MHRFLASGSLLLLPALFGCAAPPPAPVDQTLRCRPPETGKASSGPAWVTLGYGTGAEPIPLNAVLFTNNQLAENVAVQSLTSSRTPGGTVQVTARLLNCSEQAVMVRARTAFLGRSGPPAEAVSAWQPVALPGKASTLYTESSLRGEGVESFLIEIGPLQ
jgi:hypothetical protein